jgi:hypothetical protein
MRGNDGKKYFINCGNFVYFSLKKNTLLTYAHHLGIQGGIMEALYGNTNRERLAEVLLAVGTIERGFELERPLSSNEVRERELLVKGYVSDYRIRRWAAFMYPDDKDLGSYTWWTLLKDTVYFEALKDTSFFKTMYPGVNVRGRDYELDVLHIPSGQKRDKWLIDGGNPIELLVPSIWAIGVMSLKNEYHKLYVHDEQSDGINVCRDGFGHHNRGLERSHLDRLLPRIEASIGLEEWNRQAKIQGVNPCIYTFVQRWAVMALPSL